MKASKFSAAIAATALLAACGGGGGSSSGSGGSPISGTPTPTPTSTTAACSLADQKAFALAKIDEWYLFPDLIDKSVNASTYATVQDYIDALVKPARDQRKDRYFTYVTSIAEENAYYSSGSQAGFGIRLGYDTVNNAVYVIEAFENAPALNGGLDRGTRILAVGTSAGTMRDTFDIMEGGGPYAFSDALGPSDSGVTRYMRIRTAAGVESTVALTKTDYALDPVSDRYGAKVIDDNGTKVGYINLRTFIDTAEPDLRAAFQTFRNQGIDRVIIDLRYNGGGLVSIADLMGNLLGRDKNGEVFSRTTLRPSKASLNTTEYFSPQPQSITPMKIAFIGTTSSASASELVINSMIPYLGTNMALVGTNTYGKPVGQYGFDNAACDQRMRVVTFRTENADGNADYFDGLATTVPVTCRANDDIFRQLGDPQEASVAGALDFLAGRSCTAIVGGAQSAQSAGGRRVLQPERPTTAQREVPGLF
ncbi:S41 family peptidase [Croceicoccus naphthovorans]|uniref:Peptidase S41 n=1 Tax=Croceicoccus naphthovorans TaxID=1348774 RepID=A0A0G3XME4_9SPHN|nr:S41 family peptidase [Croceicoccus naphthovorans]AKM11623.1 peptidase S41 [Croceicoccus naphthovorans]MBB3991252.1 C-terminal processing protease CtpA/Prc [Croceicoccus naphthovorans]